MSYRLTNLGILLAALMGGGVCTSRVQAQGVQNSKRDFSVSETNAVEIFKSLNQLGTKDEGFKQLQNELNKTSLLPISRQSLEDAGSMSVTPLPIPSMQTRRKKEDWNQLDSWLSKPGEPGAGNPMEELLGFSAMDSSQRDKRKSSWDPILRKLTQDEFGSVGLGSTVKAAARQPTDSQEDSDLPQGIRENADKLKKLLGNDFGASLFAPTTSKGSLSDFFGARQGGASVSEDRAHKAYIDSYANTLFGNSSAAATLKSMGTLGFPLSAPTMQGPTANPLATLPSVSRPDAPKSSAMINGTIASPTLPNMNANLLNTWNPMYTQPKPELPKTAPFFTPPVEAPRRRFF